MKTVGEFKKAGVVFVGGDYAINRSGVPLHVHWFIDANNSNPLAKMATVISFAWRDLPTKPDNPQYKIELDIDNHRWRPSLNQGVEYPDEQRVNFHDDYIKYLEDASEDGITKPMTKSEYVRYLTCAPASAVVTDKSVEFKVGDLVVVTYLLTGYKYFIKLTYLDNKSFVGYIDEWLTCNSSEVDKPHMAYLEQVSIEHYNPELNELKNIIGLHDDPTECAKAILAAGYTK